MRPSGGPLLVRPVGCCRPTGPPQVLRLRRDEVWLRGFSRESEQTNPNSSSFDLCVSFFWYNGSSLFCVVPLQDTVDMGADWPSTGFLERWRPLLMWRSQYFWSATTSFEHRHFFPSVLRHRPGSGSKPPHPTNQPSRLILSCNTRSDTRSEARKAQKADGLESFAYGFEKIRRFDAQAPSTVMV
ncbi:growth regulating factor [Striga asiatica]|uniref:Growth regulating factor n=1 Tax=Striga asiatica TaxID=4170 RepID=A0A5A7PEZ5_STRAF|nr:growth regulating factor [Striga asiatica]